MTLKEYLNSIYRMETFIVSKRQRVEAFRSAAMNISSAPFSDMPKAHGRTTSPMADAICRAIDLEAEIKQDEYLLQQKKVFLLDLISTLDDIDMQSIMIKRYIEKKTWNTIVDETFFSRSWVYRLHQRALDQLDSTLSGSADAP